MPSSPPTKSEYGLSTDLFVSRKESDQTLILGGIGQGAERWVQVLTRRAAQLLWFKMTVLLYPDKANMVTGLAVTAPLRGTQNDMMTTHVEVIKNKTVECEYSIIGWTIMQDNWVVILSEIDTRRLWAALDLALFPVGWEGRETKPKKLI